MPATPNPQIPDAAQAKLTLQLDRPGPTISRHIYGHFAEHLGRCIYEGIWVGESSSIDNLRGIRKDVVAALRKLQVPVLRWPGGCFADEYHWQDGIGPREQRPKMINTHWGGVVENNHFGTHEFMDLCEQIGAEAYVCGNVGSGSVQEMMGWVEYMTSDADSPMANLRRKNGRDAPWKLSFFGVGNESWGCGGNMRPEYYADNYRRYATYVKDYGGHPVQRIACGSNGADFNWTEVLMASAARQMQGLSLHWYTLPTNDWQRKGSSTEFGEEEWHSTLFQTLRMQELVTGHAAIMDRHDPEKRVGMVVDEWGTWYDAEPGTNPGFLYQQNTLRDALAAGINLNIFNQHCDRISMANIAQTINVLQAMILTDKERMLLTPSYHAFEMYKVHQDQTLIPLELDTPEYSLGGRSVPMLHASASRAASGQVQLSLVNLHASRPATLLLPPGLGEPSGRILTAPTLSAHNTFEQPELVRPVNFTGFSAEAGSLRIEMPAKSLVVLTLG
jgi:alpha-N-arabinofuranosidase